MTADAGEAAATTVESAPDKARLARIFASLCLGEKPCGTGQADSGQPAKIVLLQSRRELGGSIAFNARALDGRIGKRQNLLMSAVASMQEMQKLSDTLAETENWVSDLMQRLGWRDRNKVYVALLGTLHALRDSLPRDEAVYVGAQMPALLRGLYYEGWHPGARIVAKSRSAFLARIEEAVHHDPGIDAEQVAHAVFALLAARLPQSELEEARAATPSSLRSFWPS
jgi:uncharacterized protein (DUF2267 family)